jgi:hypothetical protein
MTIHPKTRDLARRLLSYEVATGKSSESMESATLRVYEKLRQGLGAFAGVAAFESLASRALALAKPEAPTLGATQIAADGSIRGLGEFTSQIDNDKNQAGDDHGVILMARLLGLLFVFMGEALTLSLLRVQWPRTVFDDHSSRTGEKCERTRKSED